MKTRLLTFVVQIVFAIAAVAGAVPDSDLEKSLFISIKSAKTLSAAEENLTVMLKRYAGSPPALGRIHASMAFRYRTGPSMEPDKIIRSCREALKYPLNRNVACKVCELEGDMLQHQAKEVKLFELTALRKQALAAYLSGLKVALKAAATPEDETDEDDTLLAKDPAAWVARLKGTIEHLYNDVPYREEIVSEGEKLGVDAATLQELVDRSKNNGGAGPVAAVSLFRGFTPTPPGIKFNARDYEVDGTLEEVVMRDMFSKGQPIGRKQGNFTVFVRGCAWLIRSTMKDNTESPPLTEEIGCENGAETILLWMHEQEHAGEATLVSNNVPVNLTGADIACHLWLMLASKCYFKQQTTNWLTPAYDHIASIHGDPDLKTETEWELMDGPGSLPLKVIYYNPGGYYDLVGLNRVHFTPYPAPFKNGFTNAIYTMTGVTNFSGVAFPAGFVFEEYKVGGPGRYDLWASKHAEVTISAVRLGCSRPNLLPPADGRILVMDYRLIRAQPAEEKFTYMNSPGRWGSPVEGKNLSKQ